MARTWTVGYDGSDEAADALQWTVSTAACDDAVVPVVPWLARRPALSRPGGSTAVAERSELKADAEAVAQALLPIRDRWPGLGIPEVVEGPHTEVLLASCGPNRPVVIGRRGAGELDRRSSGPTSADLVTHATGPVVVIPPHNTRSAPRRIVVGVDGSPYGEAALHWAIEIAPDDARIETVFAVDVIPWQRPNRVEERHPESIEAARDRVVRSIDRVDTAGRVKRTFVTDVPRHALSNAFERADLVVVGPRGLGAIARTVLGSLSTWLLRVAPCPVAFVPTP